MSFGKYYLTEKIATGGMAEIYLAKLIGPGGFEKQLVIKQIHPELSDQRAFVDMFVAEAKTLVSLGHGNIVPVYELGVVDDVYFIAMEYIDGPTLRELGTSLHDAGKTMSPAIAAYITAEVLKGLDYAHRKGVIHRDISPRNVLLSRDGEVKLLDFGIAVQEGHVQSSKNPVGSYPYMSPEQVRRQSLTPQSDLFSTGVLLWEMLTGSDLFARPDADETLRAVTDAEIKPPSHLNPDSPATLDDICLASLARNLSERYSSSANFLAELNRYLYSLDELVTPTALTGLVARYCPPIVRRPIDEPRVGAPDPDEANSSNNGGAVSDDWSPESTRPVAGRITGRHGTVKLERDTDPQGEPAGSDSPGRTAGRHGTVELERGAQANRVASESSVARATGRHGTVKLERPEAASVPRARTAAGKGGDHTRPAPNRRHARRASTVRTFATAADFGRVMSPESTQPPPTDAWDDEAAADSPREATAQATSQGDHEPKPAAPVSAKDVHDATNPPTPARKQANQRRASTVRDVSTQSPESSESNPQSGLSPVTLPNAPASKSWSRIAVMVAILLFGIGVGAVIAQRAGSTAGSGTSGTASDAAGAATPAVSADASISTGQPDAGAPLAPDAAPLAPTNPTRNSGERPNPNKPAQNGDTSRRPEKTGVLKVGANPWAEVYVDGRKLGRAPGSWSVAAGQHEVEVVFPVAGREQRKRFTVTVEPDKTESLGVINFADDLE